MLHRKSTIYAMIEIDGIASDGILFSALRIQSKNRNWYEYGEILMWKKRLKNEIPLTLRREE